MYILKIKYLRKFGNNDIAMNKTLSLKIYLIYILRDWCFFMVLKKSKKIVMLCFFMFIIAIISLVIAIKYFYYDEKFKDSNSINSIINSDTTGDEFLNQISNISTEELAKDSEKDKSYIKWVDFKGTATVLKKLADADINSHVNNEPVKFNWIELMAYLGCKYGGDLSLFKDKDLENLLNSLREGKSMTELTANMKLYNYFFQSYDAIFHEYIGKYEIATIDEQENKSYTKKYGLKAFSPIAKNYYFSHYKDFGSARSYGYRRVHLGNDLLRKYWNTYYSCRIWIY